MERAEGRAHNPDIEQKKEGVKKEQDKGCGSVNRPTPGSQRPAEPVASGLFQRFQQARKVWVGKRAFGVKLWVVGTRFSQCFAIFQGVKIGVAALLEDFFLFCPNRNPHRKTCAGVNKE